jgi:hypothetical protein
VRYVAVAGVDHRRTGRDATLACLSRSAYGRGRSSRRFDIRKQTAPSLPAEIRTLAGCLGHTAPIPVRGRDRPRRPHRRTPARGAQPLTPAENADPDFLSGESGTLNRRTRATGAARDTVADLLTAPERRRLRRAARRTPTRRRVLVLCIARPEHASTSAAAVAELETSRHDVAVRLVAPRPGRGQVGESQRGAPSEPAGFRGLAGAARRRRDPPLSASWTRFLFAAERYGLRLAQPAHAF